MVASALAWFTGVVANMSLRVLFLVAANSHSSVINLGLLPAHVFHRFNYSVHISLVLSKGGLPLPKRQLLEPTAYPLTSHW